MGESSEKSKKDHFFMKQKKKLLSIGEMAQISGVSIKSLRYYDRINILKPAFTDLDSGYRYYSFDQIYTIGIIQFAVEMNIPLRELTSFIDAQGHMDFVAFGLHAKETAEKKIKALQKGLNFINLVAQEVFSQEKHPIESMYTRDIPEKYFHLIPYPKTFDDVDPYEVVKMFMNSPGYHDIDEYDWPESGFLSEYSSGGVNRYLFVEIPQNKAKATSKKIPAGRYHCRQSNASQIERARDIFSEYLTDRDSFIAIETEIFSGKLTTNTPLNELRVL